MTAKYFLILIVNLNSYCFNQFSLKVFVFQIITIKQWNFHYLEGCIKRTVEDRIKISQYLENNDI